MFGADDAATRGSACSSSRKTTGFRHDSIPAGIAAIKKLGTDNNFQVDATEDAGDLQRRRPRATTTSVVFLSTTGDPLNDTQQAAFERYIRGGGGYTGIHAAADTEYTWTWYGKLVGAYFRNHPAGTPERRRCSSRTPTTTPRRACRTRWHRTDEWYNYQAPEGAVVGGGGTDCQPAAGRRPRARQDRRVHLRRGRRQHDG